MSAKADRERVDRSAAARHRILEDGVTATRDAPTLADAIAHALALYDLTRPSLPIGGGYATHRRAIEPATFIVATLTEAGWTTGGQ